MAKVTDNACDKNTENQNNNSTVDESILSYSKIHLVANINVAQLNHALEKREG